MKTMIKKYKRIGALLLGLSCLTGGFFTPVEDCLCVSAQAADQTNTDKLPCNMTTKELFNVVYGYLREKNETITFAMPPQNTDDYGLIITYQGSWMESLEARRDFGGLSAVQYETYYSTIHGGYKFTYYIDKGSSKDLSNLMISWHFDNFVFDFDKEITYSKRKATKLHNLRTLKNSLKEAAMEDINKEMQTHFNALSARVKRTSSSTQRESSSVQRESAPVQNESTSAPSRSSRE